MPPSNPIRASGRTARSIFTAAPSRSRRQFAVFSHGGSGACVLAHLLALPFPYVCTVMPYDFTSVIILELPLRPGEYVKPRLELFNDCAHIQTQPRAPRLQQHSET